VKEADGTGMTGGGIGSGSATTRTAVDAGAGAARDVALTARADARGALPLGLRAAFVLGRACAFFARAFFLFVGLALRFRAGFSFFAAIPPPCFTSSAPFIIP
jgi:uncharacterized RDD family membrane protein YckC